MAYRGSGELSKLGDVEVGAAVGLAEGAGDSEQAALEVVTAQGRVDDEEIDVGGVAVELEVGGGAQLAWRGVEDEQVTVSEELTGGRREAGGPGQEPGQGGDVGGAGRADGVGGGGDD
jgi:hypothetical protein